MAMKDRITTYVENTIEWYNDIITFSRRFHNAGNAMYVGSESHPRNTGHPKQQKIEKYQLVVCCLISLMAITSIYLIPYIIFNDAMVWENTMCKDGYYNGKTFSEDVPNCIGNSILRTLR